MQEMKKNVWQLFWLLNFDKTNHFFLEPLLSRQEVLNDDNEAHIIGQAKPMTTMEVIKDLRGDVW